MELIIGKTAGFCYGVKRAVDGAKEELQNSKQKIYCLGEIVHNKDVVQDLEKQGLYFIEDINQAKDKVVIRAHGVPKEVYLFAKNNNIELKDYTCPNVLKIHDIVEQYQKQGYFIILCGNRNHPENIGTISYCGKRVEVIEDEENAIKVLAILKSSHINKLLLVSQTTFSLEKFYKIEKCIKQNIPSNIKLEVKNTICRATQLRQKETEEIAKKVDCMLIIGGKNSSNTKKLYDIAQKNCNNCFCIENKEDLNIKDIEVFEKIGIMAGASTPQNSIKEVICRILR